MRFTQRLALVAAFLPLAATPVTAQRWTWDFGINGGYSMFTKALDEEDTGLGEDVAGSSVRFSPGWLLGSQLGYWWGPNFGTRLNFRYAKRDLEGNEAVSFVEGVNLLGGTIDLMYRFSPPRDEYEGMEFLPYITGGAGLRRFSTGGDFTCTIATDSTPCAPFTTGAGAEALSFALEEGSAFTGLIGLGADWRLARNWSIRTEINDMIFKPEIKPVTATGDPQVFAISDDESVSTLVHEFGVQVGVHYLFGPARSSAVAVAPAPPPPPAAGQPTQPTPLTPAGGVAGATEEAITVCVIDPTTAGGIRMESAVFVPSIGDTLVMVNGQRVSLRSVKGSVVVASDADWYVRGAPLVMTVGTQKVELVTTGAPRLIAATDLAFLGTINGMPVYANAVEVQGVSTELAELNRAQPGVEFGKLLHEHKDIHQRLAAVKTYYVPLQPTGCVFQALQVQDQIRKKQEQQ